MSGDGGWSSARRVSGGAGRYAIPAGGRPLVYGHRGCSLRAPENTLAAFAAAGELAAAADAADAAAAETGAGAAEAANGVTGAAVAGRVPRIGVELDVQLSRDGEVVVIHDFTLQRVAGLPERVSQTPWSELRTVDVGSWFDQRYGGERIPLLSQVFELLGPRVCYDIELKHRVRGETGLEARVAEIIRHHGVADRCIVSSFNPYALRAVRRHAPELPLAPIYANSPDVPWALRRGAGRFLLSADLLKPEWEQAPRALSRRRIGRRLPVLPWTVNDPQTARELLARGCIGVISDAPETIVAGLQTPHPS